jgi:hypothetical protein
LPAGEQTFQHVWDNELHQQATAKATKELKPMQQQRMLLRWRATLQWDHPFAVSLHANAVNASTRDKLLVPTSTIA